MPQLKFAPDMCIFLLASFFMTPEVLACFSDSECFYHFLFMCLICIGECVSVMEKILVMNIKTSMNSLCILRPIVLSILVQTSLYPGNIRAMLSNFLRVPCTFSFSYSSSSFSSSSSSSSSRHFINVPKSDAEQKLWTQSAVCVSLKFLSLY